METNRRDIIMSFAIKEIYVEYQKAPIGLDEKRPRFSWIFSSVEKNMRQSACRILVKKVTPAAQEKIVWDSGKLETGESRGVEYAGEELEACTVYSVSVQVWDAEGNSACEDTCFETGMLNFSAEEEDINRGLPHLVFMYAHRPEGYLSWRRSCVWNRARGEQAWCSAPMISGC